MPSSIAKSHTQSLACGQRSAYPHAADDGCCVFPGFCEKAHGILLCVPAAEGWDSVPLNYYNNNSGNSEFNLNYCR